MPSKLGALISLISLIAHAISLLVKGRQYFVLGGHEVLKFVSTFYFRGMFSNLRVSGNADGVGRYAI